MVSITTFVIVIVWLLLSLLVGVKSYRTFNSPSNTFNDNIIFIVLVVISPLVFLSAVVRYVIIKPWED